MYDMKRNWNDGNLSVIIGATRPMKKNFKNYLANILREPCAREIQTIAFKGMVIILKSLSICQVVPQPPKKGEGAYKYTYPPSSYKPNSQTLVVQIIYKEI